MKLDFVIIWQYYLGDAGYGNCEGFLTPFRATRYHLKEWGVNRPNTPQELFNLRHSCARNVIERAFGVLKKWWAILRDSTWFSPEVVSRMVHACCLLHNFIKKEVGIDEVERAFNHVPLVDMPANANEEVDDSIPSMLPSPEWTAFRNNLAEDMWQSRTRC